MSTSHLVAFADLSSVGYPNSNGLGDTRLQVVTVFLREDTDVDDLAVLPVGNSQARVFYVTSLFTEDGSQELFFSSKFGFTLRSDLSDENVTWSYPRTNSHYSIVIEVPKTLFTDVWNVTSNFFRPKLRLSSFDLVLVNVNRRIAVFLHKVFVQYDRVFVVVTIKGHEAN